MEKMENRIQELRTGLVLTQAEVAKRAGINLSHYRKVETGETRDPRLGTARAIAAALRTHVDVAFPIK